VETAVFVPDGHTDWLQWSETWDDWAAANGKAPYEREAKMLHADKQGILGFVAMLAVKT
jgi:hypothetical protein